MDTYLLNLILLWSLQIDDVVVLHLGGSSNLLNKFRSTTYSPYYKTVK